MRYQTLVLLAITPLAVYSRDAKADVDLGTAGTFAVLAGSTVTNTGPTIIDGGDVGVSPGTAITGAPSIVAPYTTHSNDADAIQAQKDLTTAYNTAAGLPVSDVLTGQDLGGLTLTPGVYFFKTSAQLTGTLTLDDQGNPMAQFVFQIGSTLTTASNSSVVTIDDDGSSDAGCSVYWQIGSSATLGTETAFEGHILADASITLNTGATILDGSALARVGAVTLDSNSITNAICYSSSTTGPGGGTGGSGGSVPLPPPLFSGLVMISLLAAGCGFKRVKLSRDVVAVRRSR
jgi:Ice-binding-like